MLTLVTGQPGNGKTLWTLNEIERQRKEAEAKGTPRAVYQHGISGLVLPWLELENPREWFGCPEGSIIVIDEAWKPFPVRKQGAAVPQYCEEFATHRHHGFDVFLITQHRHQIDTFVRKMVGRHIHVVRKFGRESSQVFQWEKETDTTSEKEKDTAIKTDWEFPKDSYDWYKSAEVHTVKKDFPWRRFWWLPVLVLLVLGLIWFSVHRVLGLRNGAAKSNEPVTQSSGAVPPQTWSEASFHARMPRYPRSAPFFDGADSAGSTPHITGCMQLNTDNAVSCRCADQSGADVEVSVGECTRIVRMGIFNPGVKYSDSKAENIAYLQQEKAVVSDGAGVAVGGGSVAARAAPAQESTGAEGGAGG